MLLLPRARSRGYRETECKVDIGSTGPFVMWIDGEQALRSDKTLPYAPWDHSYKTTFSTAPRRVVIKLLRLTDEFEFGVNFVKTAASDKTAGEACFVDNFGSAADLQLCCARRR